MVDGIFSIPANFWTGQRILVTGGSGFIGRRLCAALLAQGAHLRILTRYAQQFHPRAQLQIYSGDISDAATLTTLCRDIDIVLHLAGFAHAQDDGSADFNVRHWAVNAQGTFNILAAALAAQVRRFVFVSSVQAVGNPGAHCVNEDWDAPAQGAYGAAKRAAEQRILEVGANTHLQTVILRPPLVYGAGAQANLARLIQAVRQGWFPPLPETGNCRSLVHVEDVVQALFLAAAHPQAVGRTYFINDGQCYSGREIYAAICQALGRPVPHWAVPASILWGAAYLLDKLRGGGNKMHNTVDKVLGWACYDAQRIMDELGYKPRWNLQRALTLELRTIPSLPA